MGDYNFGLLLECVTFSWEVAAVADFREGNLPHMKAMVMSDVDGDDRFLRGEIMTITDIMAARLRKLAWVPAARESMSLHAVETSSIRKNMQSTVHSPTGEGSCVLLILGPAARP
ncbi:hypothetical protein BO71DRAFT_488063 [Aspergillus ellipticus CBS 707.79]|uniref:Uncharacterized protein n=1 Tax=Aspergillus ellipticus CBS 707.79 TaxID=1448320 RepID=A0A319CVK7_9EURO|nr:hypothetical protein BO71DRAFT_488063 [Aspergillus ellipticus CBS 707.79]